MKTKTKMKRALNKYPRGWNRKKVQELTEYYENQTEDEAVAEMEAAFKEPEQAVVFVPRSLLPKIHKLLAAHAGRK
jgi:hypothetical protein